MQIRTLAALAGLALCAAGANAQFITGITKPVFSTNQPNAYFVDAAAGSSTFLFDIQTDLGIPATAPGFGGLAGDDANRRFFASVRNGPKDDIYEFSYDNLFSPVKLVETKGSAGQQVAVDGLAYDTLRGVMYATRTLASANEAEGLFTVDLTTGTLTTVLDYATQPGGASAYSIAAIDYDASLDLLFLVDETATGGRWIYSLSPTNIGAGFTPVAQLPANIVDVDGLGAGNGMLLLVTDNASANDGLHWVYDYHAGTFTGIASPYPAPAGTPIAPNPSSGGAFTPNIPAPGVAAAFALAGLAGLRRRR
ncbi:MAG: hypothetical protein KF864_04215 [Phycisphaeraceae bacterium]|nr:hypothetical protein [Phycisphaeraceae bacterium]